MALKLARRCVIALLALGLAMQAATAADLQSSDPTAAVTVFDSGHRIDANGLRGK
jgi:hypothetical protein